MMEKKSKNIVTVLLHDYYHRCVFNNVISEKDWNRLESRLEEHVDRALDLFAQYGIKATFFTLGWLAEKKPSLVRKIAEQGHEIASAGYRPISIEKMTPDEFRHDLRHSRELLEAAGANHIIGYRSPHKWFNASHQWALDILIEEGFQYDASYKPKLWSLKSQPDRFAREYQSPKGSLWEVPVSTARVLGFNVPISGGNYLRQFPEAFLKREFEKWSNHNEAPFVLYFHPWELDTEQPRINSVGLLSYIRQYRNLGKLADLLPYYFEHGDFQSVNSYLEIPLEYPRDRKETTQEPANVPMLESQHEDQEEVSVVVPCYNESSSLSYLAKALQELEHAADGQYKFSYIFVDDHSKDDTYAVLQKLFGQKDNCKIIRHEQNKGVAAAIETGIKAAETKIVCSIDADCTYDPVTLLDTIPLLSDEADVVVASPYHKDGGVLNVPGWRLLLSKHLSKFYHLVFKNKLSTYTSCFRVYNREAVAHIDLKHGDYIGIVELLARVDMQGGKIIEFPTTLQSRLLGHSKMKVLKTIGGHIKFLLEIIRTKAETKISRFSTAREQYRSFMQTLTWKL